MRVATLAQLRRMMRLRKELGKIPSTKVEARTCKELKDNEIVIEVHPNIYQKLQSKSDQQIFGQKIYEKYAQDKKREKEAADQRSLLKWDFWKQKMTQFWKN